MAMACPPGSTIRDTTAHIPTQARRSQTVPTIAIDNIASVDIYWQHASATGIPASPALGDLSYPDGPRHRRPPRLRHHPRHRTAHPRQTEAERWNLVPLHPTHAGTRTACRNPGTPRAGV